MEILRKGGITAAGIILALLIIFEVLFADAIAGGILKKTGESIFRAKVKIEKTDVKFMQGRIFLEGVTVGDKNAEFKNFFEFNKAGIKIDILPLISGKVIIDSIELSDLMMGTKRETPGLLPREKTDDSLAEQVNDTKESHVSLPEAENGKKEPLIPKKEDLNAYKEIQNQKELAANKAEKIKNAATKAGLEDRAAEIKKKAEELKDLKAGPADAAKIKKALAALDSLKKEIDALQADADKIKKDAAGLYNMKSTASTAVNKAVQKDVNDILAKAGISSLNPESILKSLTGPAWYGAVDGALGVLSFADKFITPGNKAKEKGFSEVKRGKGSFILFGRGKYPDFLIKEIKISGKGSGKDAFSASGVIKNICPQQHIIGKPLTADISAKGLAGVYRVKAKINRINGINDTLAITGKNLPLSFFGIENREAGGVTMKKAGVSMSVNADRNSSKTGVSGKVGFNKPVFEGNSFAKQLNSAGNFNIMFEGVKTEDKTDFNVASDVFSKLASGAGNKAADDIEKKVIAEIAGDKTAMFSSVNKNIKDVKGAVSEAGNAVKSAETEIEKAKSELKKKLTGRLNIF